MNTNLNLEKFQATTYDNITGEYTFEIEHGGKTNISPKLKARKPGISLHFLRYGYFPKKDYYAEDSEKKLNAYYLNKDDGGVYPTTDESYQEKCNVSDLATLDGFFKSRSILNQGFLYLFDANDSDKILELEIVGPNVYKPIFWANNKKDGAYLDKRISSKNNMDNIIVNKDSTFYIGYSLVQWSIAFIQNIQSKIQSEDQTEDDQSSSWVGIKYLTKIECSGFARDSNVTDGDALPYYSVITHLRKSEKGKGQFIEKLKVIHKLETYEDSLGGNDILEDMFVTLPDSVGALQDIIDEVKFQVLVHKANYRSIYSGIAPDKIIESMIHGGKKIEETTDVYKHLQLVDYANAVYQFVYNDSDMEETYDGGERLGWGKGVYKPKLLNILGVEYRKKQRELISDLQFDLLNFYKSDYLQNALKQIDISNNTGKNNLDLNHFILATLALIKLNPHDFDRNLDLKSDYEAQKYFQLSGIRYYNTLDRSNVSSTQPIYKEVEDEKLKFVEESWDGGSEYFFKDVLNREEDIVLQEIDIKDDADIIYKFGGTIENIFECFSDAVISDWWVYNRFSSSTSPLLRKFVKLFKKIKIGGVNLFHVSNQQILLTHSAVSRITSIQPRTVSIIKSGYFTGPMALLQAFNTVLTLRSGQYNTIGNMGKSGLSIAASMLDVSTGLMKYADSLKGNTLILKEGTNGFTKCFRFLKLGGAGVGLGCTVWDMCGAFADDDDDKGWVLTGATLVGLYSLGAELGSYISALSFLGPYGWIAAIAGFALAALAMYLTDSELEKYLKHIVFSDNIDVEAVSGELPFQYNQRFLTQVNSLIQDFDEEYHKYSNLEIAHDELSRLLMGYNITFEEINKKLVAGHYVVKDYKIKIAFNQFFDDIKQVDYQVLIAKDGNIWEQIDYEYILAERSVISSNAAPLAILTINLPINYLKEIESNAEIAVLARLLLPNGQSYPMSKENETLSTIKKEYVPSNFFSTRWLASKSDGIYSLLNVAWFSSKDSCVTTLNDIYNSDPWN